MIPVIAVDDRNGMMFHNRRQSRDRLLKEKILAMAKGRTLWMNAYSYSQFEGHGAEKIRVAEDFLERAGEGDYCFVEDRPLEPFLHKITEIVACRWNRKYPGDVFLDVDLEDGTWKRTAAEEIAGSSHERITIERYRHEA